MMTVTLEEIAKAAGVSLSTASRALHNSKYAINEDTRRRINELAKEMGYTPNLSARGLRGKNSFVIGVVVENISDPFTSQIVRGITDQLKIAGYWNVIVNTDYDQAVEKDAIATLVSNRTDGIIFVHSSIHTYDDVLGIDNSQPYVILNRIQPPGENTIGLDDYYGSQLAVNHLLKLRHQQIAFISGPENWWTSRERLAGYMDALKLHGFPVRAEYIAQGDWEVESGWTATRQLLALPEPPDAIFAGNDLMALGAVYAVQDAGLGIPQNVAIIGHDDREFTQIVRPALSTVRMPCYEMGYTAVKMLLKRLESGESIPASLIRGELVVRDSCGGSRLLPSISRSETQVGRDVVVIRKAGNRRFHPLPVSDVRIEGEFWGWRQALNRQTLIPAIYEQLNATAYIEAIKLTWKLGMPDPPTIFTEIELTQWMEAASNALAVQPDDDLQGLLNTLIDLLIQAQQPDGYLNSYYTVVEPGGRFTNLRDKQELHSAGHLIEAAIAHHLATGEYRFLNVALRFADLICAVFGSGEHQKHGYPGYPGIEVALVSLYRLTGDRHYLEMARYFVNQRGQQPHYFEQEAAYRGEDTGNFEQKTYQFNQSHLPVREQTEAVGNAAYAVQLYAAMTDLGVELGDETLIQAVQQLYESAFQRRMYVTGAIGSAAETQGFTYDYDLPNESACASTSAAVGLLVWMQRMLHLDCDGQYSDVIERVLYNALLGSLSLDGLRCFDTSVLKVNRERHSSYHRQAVLAGPNSAPNISRLLASLGQYLYSQGKAEAIVHQYAQSSGVFQFADHTVVIKQTTQYPWQGTITLALTLDAPHEFTLKLRIPAWCRSYSLRVNQNTWSAKDERGYISIRRQWQNGDEILLNLDMPVERVYAHPKVNENRGRVALQRGPIVYCLEAVDNLAYLDAIVLPQTAQLDIKFEPDLLGGVVTLYGEGLSEGSDDHETGQGAYSSRPPSLQPFTLKAVPYFSWDNRESGNMLVWIRESVR